MRNICALKKYARCGFIVLILKRGGIMKISIIGSGIVGQGIGKVFAKTNDVIFQVHSKDTKDKLDSEGYKTEESLERSILDTDISFIALPTPLDEETKHFNYSVLKTVSEEISKILLKKDGFHVFVLKCTVTPGTTRNLFIPLLEKEGKKAGKDFGVVYNPEFLSFIQDTWTDKPEFHITPEREGRIILGIDDEKTGNIVEEFYKKIHNMHGADSSCSYNGTPIFKTNFETAEYKKLFANSRLALAVSYANESFLITEKLKGKYDIDINFVTEKTSMDKRIGKYGSVFGKAYGGPCFLKDLPAFVSWVKDELGIDIKLVKDTVEINEIMKEKYGIRE